MTCLGCSFYKLTLFIVLFSVTLGVIWLFNNCLKFWELVGLLAVAYLIPAWYIYSISNERR